MKKKSTNIIAKISIIGIFALMVLACVSYNGSMTKAQLDSMVGQNISLALQQYGPPSYVNDDGKGGKIYTWAYKEDGSTYTGYNTQYHYSVSSTEHYSCVKDMYANANGTIYYWRMTGNRCK